MPEPLLDDFPCRFLKAQTFGQNHYLLQKVDSTNQFAKKLAAEGAAEGTLVYAEQQTKGRGRWGRNWESHPGKGLQFSLVLRPKQQSSSGPLLTLLGAVSVVTVLEDTFRVRFQLQWPNDLVFGERKIAGVLTETLRNRSGVAYAVLGIGLNVNQRQGLFSPQIRERAASLAMVIGKDVDRFRLFADILFQLESDYNVVQQLGYRSILERWVSHSNLLEKKIVLKVNDGVERGWVKGFHSNGDLILLSEKGGSKRFSNGHVLEVQHAACD